MAAESLAICRDCVELDLDTTSIGWSFGIASSSKEPEPAPAERKKASRRLLFGREVSAFEGCGQCEIKCGGRLKSHDTESGENYRLTARTSACQGIYRTMVGLPLQLLC